MLKREGVRTDKLANGDLLRKGTLGVRLVPPAVMHGFTDPEKLREEKGYGSDECAGEPPQSATHDRIGVDTDDGEEDGEASAPYNAIEAEGYEVVRRDAAESRKIRFVVYVHEHAGKLHE